MRYMACFIWYSMNRSSGVSEKEAVEAADVRAVFRFPVHLHVGLPCGHGDACGIHDVDALSRVRYLPVSKEGYTDDHEYGGDEAARREKWRAAPWILYS